MATFNVSRAARTVTSQSFVMSMALVGVGAVVGQMWTNWARDNLVDVGVRGGDVAYALGLGIIALALLPNKWARPVALGAGSSALVTAAREFGVV